MKLVAAIVLLLGSAQASAAPIYYTFETTQVIYNANHDMLSEYIGLKYVFSVDRGLRGSYTYNGETTFYEDFTNSSQPVTDVYDIYYVELILGNYIKIDEGDGNINDSRINNYGVELTRSETVNNSIFRSVALHGGTINNTTFVQQVKYNNTLLEWSIGSTWELYDYFRTIDEIDNPLSRFYVEIVDISDKNPVAFIPTPPALLIFLTGLIGLGFARRDVNS